MAIYNHLYEFEFWMTEKQIQLVVGLVRLKLRTIWPCCLPTSFPGFSPTHPLSLRRAGRREPWEQGWLPSKYDTSITEPQPQFIPEFFNYLSISPKTKTDNTSLFFKIFVVGFPSVLEKLKFFLCPKYEEGKWLADYDSCCQAASSNNVLFLVHGGLQELNLPSRLLFIVLGTFRTDDIVQVCWLNKSCDLSCLHIMHQSIHQSICKCPTPGTDQVGKCPAVAQGQGGGLGTTGID